MTIKQYRDKCIKRGDEAFYAFMENALEIWQNDACIGYMIIAAEDAGLTDDQIRELISQIKEAFDVVTIDEAAERWRHSRF